MKLNRAKVRTNMLRFNKVGDTYVEISIKLRINALVFNKVNGFF